MKDMINQIWGNWQIEELIGEGAFGKVYKVKREDTGKASYSAVKVMHIPQDAAEIKDLQRSGMDFSSIHSYYEDMTKNLVNEIQIMESLKSATNIVTIEDYQVISQEGEIGWDIYIRMELLEDLGSYLERNVLQKDQIVKLGIDICNALNACEKVNVIHRDIKIDNVFFNGFDSFKLGDFGIAKQLEKTRSAVSQKGTNMYMAPEVMRGELYDKTVDIYSLGIMLYRLLNRGRFPFQPPADKQMLYSDTEKAMEMRLSGEKMQSPEMADNQLSQIILKACSYKPKDRYQTAGEMLEALKIYQQNMLEDEQNITVDMKGKAVQDNETFAMFYKENHTDAEKEEKRVEVAESIKEEKNKIQQENKATGAKKKKNIIIICVLAILILGAGTFGIYQWFQVHKDTSGLAKEFTSVDKLKISARMPEGWKIKKDEDKAVAYIESVKVKKEISFTMDYYWKAVEDSSKVGIDSSSEKSVPNGASDKYATEHLNRLYRAYTYVDKINFDEKLEESAIYEINGREYYYLQYDAGDDVNVAFYYTVQDGSEIYYRLRVEGDKISKEDRKLFDNVLRSVNMDVDSVDYSKLRAKDYIEDVYALNDEKMDSKELGISVGLPKACKVSNDDNGIVAEYKGNSYSEEYKGMIGDNIPYKITITSEDASLFGSLENGMNEEVANQLVIREEKDKGRTIINNEYQQINGRNYLRLISNDVGGKYLSYFTMYQGKLLAIVCSQKNPDEALSIKSMVRSMLENLEFQL